MSGFSVIRKVLPGAACALSLLLSGCAFTGGSVATGGNGTSPLKTGNMGGVARGGRQGIYNATVTLYGMTSTGAIYGATPTTFAVTKTTDSNGTFAFTKSADGTFNYTPASGNTTTNTWSCPAGASSAAAGTQANPYIYLVGSGGDTSGTGAPGLSTNYNNSYAKLMVVLGACSQINTSTSVVMNEATTVASMVALQQFFNPATQAIGAPASNLTGLTNAVNMISTNLVNASNGEFMGCLGGTCTSFTVPGSTVAGISVTATPEQNKLNTMANVLAACVSTNPTVSGNCATLVTNAVSPSVATAGGVTLGAANTNFPGTAYATATDTLEAIDYMLINPTESQDDAVGSGKFYNLYTLGTSANAPFAPGLTAQPLDWTIGINFQPSGTCTSLVGTPAFAFDSYSMVQDAGGNIWLSGSGSGDVLAQISPVGAAINCVNSGVSNGTGRRIAIDNRGNLWWATAQGLIEYVTDTVNTTVVGKTLTWPYPTSSQTGNNNATPAVPVSKTFTMTAAAVTADQNGNIFIAPDTLSAVSATAPAEVGYVYEYPGVSTMSSPFTSTSSILPLGTTPLANAGSVYRDMTVNANGTLVVVGSGGAYVYAYTTTAYNSGGASPVNGYSDIKVATTSAAASTVYGATLLNDGTTVGGNTCCARAGGLYQITNATTPAQGLYSPTFVGGQNADRSVFADGANNIWTGGATYPNNTANQNSIGETTGPNSTNSSLSYASVAPAGTVPTGCTSSNSTTGGCETNGGYIKGYEGINSTYALAVDASGNVWAAPDSSVQSNYFAIIGQAVPIVGPVVQNIH